jgi:pimeloyl-ACP methyl ester carboxylesterase
MARGLPIAVALYRNELGAFAQLEDALGVCLESRIGFNHDPDGSSTCAGRRSIIAKLFFFGVTDRPLLGSLHQSKRLRPRSASVLLCNPMGVEAQQSHRLYRVLAEHLEQSGFTALRFDYSGTGDSAGGSESATISGWIGDIATASEELGRAAPGTRLVAVGLRMGATLASLATARSTVRARHIVLWDPVVDGLAYLRELASSHRTLMREELHPIEWPDTLAVDEEGIPSEALGMPLTPMLVGELRKIDLCREPPKADHVTVICTRATAEMEKLRSALAGRAGHRWLDVATSSDWSCDAALNAATVPMDIIREILANIQTTNP